MLDGRGARPAEVQGIYARPRRRTDKICLLYLGWAVESASAAARMIHRNSATRARIRLIELILTADFEGHRSGRRERGQCENVLNDSSRARLRTSARLQLITSR